MTVVESVVKLGVGKDKLKSSKSKERAICQGNHEEDSGNGYDNDDGNGKPRVRRKNPTKRRARSNDFFMMKSTIKGDDMLDKEPKKLGSNKRKVEAKRVKVSKKKQVKYFLCRGPHELQNCLKQVIVKENETLELVESSEGLSPKKEVSLSSNLGENMAMKIVKLGPMKLNSSKMTELVKLLARFPLMKEVSLASNLKEEVAMQTLKLGSMRLTSINTLDELPPLGKVGCASNFGKVVIRGKSSKRRKKLRHRDKTEANQVSAILKAQRGCCKNGWGRMSQAVVQIL
ncbi:hypothetical protein J1N35_011772 [Gossypium stocksii]|uniref:Uncharacterized protein n=1 Tax=Gossypium stocksii TaxID=47602 RepID=A0A9D3W314_9ROSI|nr:hypothetical protein J1N35_011772 [Gossypium stocksii]